MKYRKPSAEVDFYSMMSHEQKVTQTLRGINKLNEVIDWEMFREELESIMGSEIGAKEVDRPMIRC